MKIKLILYFIVFTTLCNAQTVNIPDANFKNALLNMPCVDADLNGTHESDADLNNDSQIDASEAASIQYLNISGKEISDLTGIQSFTNLKKLDCSHNTISNMTINNSLQSLNASFNTIHDFTLQFNSIISSINISNNLLSDLTIYSCSSLNTLVYNENPSLTNLMIANTNITNLNIADFLNLTSINCNYNPNSDGVKLNSVIVSNLPMATSIMCGNNNLTTLDIKGFPNLNYIGCYNNNLSSLNLEDLPSLVQIYCPNNSIESLNTSTLSNLFEINCSSNQITSLDLSNLKKLRSVDCSHNLISSISVNNSILLTNFNCSYNQILTINASGLSNLQVFDCSNNNINSINTTGLADLQTLKCANNQLSSINVNGLTGLLRLYCLNNQLQSLDLSGLSDLYYLDFSNNKISTIDVSSNLNLQTLYCSDNQLTTIALAGLNELTYFICDSNNLTTLSISNLQNLGLIRCAHNQLTSLSVTDLSILNGLDCSYNLLQSITLSNLPNTLGINCNNNLLPTLDLNSVSGLYELSCNNNRLTSLLIKVAHFTYGGGNICFSGNPDLQYICADEAKFPVIEAKILEYGYKHCTVSSYCTMYPSGNYYLIEGNSTYDREANGCDSNDITIPNMKFSISNGSTSGDFISGTSGTYSIPVRAGSTVIAPKLENPGYFNVSPASVTVSFPTNPSPFNQNFCISKRGNFNDLEIVILPLGGAIPGFDVLYKIVYKNKGLTVQTGSINLIFNDDITDYISADPAISNQANSSLTWNFANLLPFESKEIFLVLNLNSPIEQPWVNSGDILTYSVSISGSMDETQADNSATLNQTVVNSFDPNDKVCLEGSKISPEMIGQYVHYMIRFENNGTANAQNIVVKDNIDITKFDINTLIPISSSHLFEIRILNSNRAEFLFQNINLPFTPGSNNGYISFKIKTKSTLVVGDSISNQADIYFDYNYPIETNNYVTKIQISENTNYESKADITAFSPNPVKDILQFKTIEKVSKAVIYDLTGKILCSYSVNQNKVNLSKLKTGYYILKIYSENGTSIARILKE